MKATLAAMSPEEISTRSYAACERLMKLPEYLNAQVLMLYLPIPQEVDVATVALHAWQSEKIVLAPKIDWSQRHML
ncbi:MAG: 5-formyltetrahydrofolate cyclo-ligase, partial [Planctomycetota bacterium]